MSQEDANWFTQNSIDIYERGLENGMKKGMEQGLQQGAEKKAIETTIAFLKEKNDL